MSLFPMFLKLEGRPVVVVGGGRVAEGKISGLLEAGARLRVVAPVVTPKIAESARLAQVRWSAKTFAPEDLDGAVLAIAATSAPGVNEAVFHAAEAREILCNAVDDVQHCHFYYGAVVHRGDLQIAISTNGKSPALAQRLRQELEMQFSSQYEAWLQRLGAVREALRRADSDSESTKQLLHEMASPQMFEAFVRETAARPRGQGTT